tara:strand:- start:481 stop:876 length:396 start_codon:yes stop_codon:yes gene_type:complete
MNSRKSDLEGIKDIGPIVSENIFNFFHNKDNIKIINKFIKFNLDILYEKKTYKEKSLNGSFVITGVFENFTREELKEILSEKGASITNTVSKNTTALIVGKNPGSKYQKALDLNIEIININKLVKLLSKSR